VADNGALDTGGHRVRDLAITVVAFVVLVPLALARAGQSAGLSSSERLGYLVGSIVAPVLFATAARWLWLRLRRGTDTTSKLVSPWIPVGAVIIAVLSLLGAASRT